MSKSKPQKPIRPFVDEIYAPLPDTTRMLRRRPGWLWSALSVPLFVGLLVLAVILIAIPFLDALKLEDDVFDVRSELIYLYGLIAVFIVFFWWVRKIERRPLSTIGWTADRAFSRYVRGFAFGIASLLACIGLVSLFGGYTIESWAPAFSTEGAVLLAVLFLGGFIIQGASEEITCRGWHMSGLAARSGLAVAIVLNSLVFAAMHLGNIDTINWIAMLNLFLFGVFASFYALGEKSLAGICGWHSSWNWFLGTGLGLEVSGWNYPSSPWLVDLAPQGSEIISGGAFGPEGSVFTTLVLVVIGYGAYRVWQGKREIS